MALEYNTYCVRLYGKDGFVIDNDNPPELADDEGLVNAFMAERDLYDSSLIDNNKKFRYVGLPDEEARETLLSRIKYAVELLAAKTNSKYIIQNDIDLNF